MGVQPAAHDSLWQDAVVPNWAETAAVYLDWLMFTTNSTEKHSQLFVTVGDETSTIAFWSVWNNEPPSATWFWMKIPIDSIAAYRGRTLTTQVTVWEALGATTVWYVDNVRLYFACGSWIANTEGYLP